VAVVESAVHERESRPRPDLGLLELLHDLSGGRRLLPELDAAALETRGRLSRALHSGAGTREHLGNDPAP
jgi:hypothetical protein